MTVLVSGARGRIAARVMDGLVAAGVGVRAGSTDPAVIGVPDGVDVVRGNIRQADVFADALVGVDGLFLYADPRTVDDVVAALRKSDVKRVVLLSSSSAARADDTTVDTGEPPLTAQSDPIAWQHVVAERALATAGVAVTFVRPGAFATNTLRWAPAIRAEQTVRLARPGFESAPVDERDIADVAVRALLESGHEDARYLLTGPESLSQRRQVETIGDAIGRQLRLVELSDDEARQQLAAWAPPLIAERLMAMYIAGDGKPADVSDTVDRVLGRPARPFIDWATHHADDFR